MGTETRFLESVPGCLLEWPPSLGGLLLDRERAWLGNGPHVVLFKRKL